MKPSETLYKKQYNLYFALLQANATERQLYLGISERVYKELFRQEAIQFVTKMYQIKLLVVNLAKEEIVEWIN